MKGAREYANLFTTGQYGRLYIVSGRHARGQTFRIYVLPKGEAAKSNGDNNPCLNDNAVEVYGVVGGQPGWTESYGWLHEGKWQQDFERLVESKKLEREAKLLRDTATTIETQQAENQRVMKLLNDY